MTNDSSFKSRGEYTIYPFADKSSGSSYPDWYNGSPDLSTYLTALNQSQPMIGCQFELIHSRWPRTIFFAKNITIPELTTNNIEINHAGFTISIPTHPKYGSTEINFTVIADKEGYHYYDWRNMVFQTGHPLVAGDPRSTIGEVEDTLEVWLRNSFNDETYHHWLIHNFKPTTIGSIELSHDSSGFVEFQITGTFTHVEYDCGVKISSEEPEESEPEEPPEPPEEEDEEDEDEEQQVEGDYDEEEDDEDEYEYNYEDFAEEEEGINTEIINAQLAEDEEEDEEEDESYTSAQTGEDTPDEVTEEAKAAVNDGEIEQERFIAEMNSDMGYNRSSRSLSKPRQTTQTFNIFVEVYTPTENQIDPDAILNGLSANAKLANKLQEEYPDLDVDEIKEMLANQLRNRYFSEKALNDAVESAYEECDQAYSTINDANTGDNPPDRITTYLSLKKTISSEEQRLFYENAIGKFKANVRSIFEKYKEKKKLIESSRKQGGSKS